jgi:hypothetical protein
MKKITALVTALVLGASSAAMAAPGFESRSRGPANDRTPMGQSDRYRPFRPVPQSWVTLESSGSLARGRDFINVSASARFSKLKLESASRGSLFIDKVIISFANGQKQVVELDKTLGSRTGAALIDVEGRSRQITRIAVMGRSGYRGTYTLSAL